MPRQRHAGIPGFDTGVVEGRHQALDIGGAAVEKPGRPRLNLVLDDDVAGHGGTETEKPRMRSHGGLLYDANTKPSDVSTAGGPGGETPNPKLS